MSTPQTSSPSPLSIRTLILRSLGFFRRSHGTLGLGIASATAVIVGALVIGDSMRGSLRQLTTQRLASVTHLLRSRYYFNADILRRVDASAVDPSLSLSPAVLLTNCSAESRTSNDSKTAGTRSQETTFHRASQVQVIGIDEQFMASLLSKDREKLPDSLGQDEIAINASLASELRVGIGDKVTLKLARTGSVPADSPLGRRDDGPVNLPQQKVVAILSDESIGGLGLYANQQVTLNAFVARHSLQDLLDRDGMVNAAFVMSKSPSQTPQSRELDWATHLNERLRPKLEDYGLVWKRHVRTFPDADRGETSDDEPITVFDVYQLSSNELMMDAPTARTIVNSLVGSQETDVPCYELLTYLANTISKVPTPPHQESERGVRSLDSNPAIMSGRGDVKDSRATSPPGDRVVPYSIVVGIARHQWEQDRETPYSYLNFRPFSQVPMHIRRGPYCWVNSWLANELQLSPGDWIQMQFYRPETIEGEPQETSTRMMVAGIVPIEQPAAGYRRNRPARFTTPPTEFNDPDLTPIVPGITDQESISNWDVPFTLTHQDLILPQDDQYWEDHRLTPKIFMPLRFAQDVFESRFGATTAIRITADSTTSEGELRARIEESLVDLRPRVGFTFQPIRYQQLTASSGATPFDALFLALSFFVIIAALLLVALLFKLGIQQRSTQLGLLLAQGFTTRRIQRLILAEMLVVACVGAILGIPIGLAYAKFMMVGLESWWLGAIQDRFLEFHVRPISLLWGALAGVLASMVTIALSLRSGLRVEPLNLLHGDHGDTFVVTDYLAHRQRTKAGLGIASICLLGAILIAGLAFGQTGMLRAGFFFGSGMLLLAGSLIGLRTWLRLATTSGSVRHEDKVHDHSSPEIAGRNLNRYFVGSSMVGHGFIALAIGAITRNPMRSTLTIGLLAVASFLIASMSVFRASPDSLGYGSFDLVGVSSHPIYDNLGSPKARAEAIGDKADRLLGSTIVPIRMNEGDDASCTNLYQVNRPTILGLSERLQKLNELTADFAFSWSASMEPESPWSPIERAASGVPELPIPVILDQNTALWSLKQGGSLGSIIQLDIDGRTVHFQVVGLLSNSILQGKLIISERNFEKLFPKVNGYRFFLIRSSDTADSNKVAAWIEEGWTDEGMDVTASATILERLLGVQNTYISAFQSLGALGLLLGTLGMIAVQTRSILERRSELALMQAVGFSKWRLGKLLTIETALLLVAGLLIGVACSALALIPYSIEVGPQWNVAGPLTMIAAVLLAGFVASTIAVRFALKLPLLDSLRGR